MWRGYEILARRPKTLHRRRLIPRVDETGGGRAAEAGEVAEEVTVADSIRKIVSDELTDVPEAKTAALREKLEGILKDLARHFDDRGYDAPMSGTRAGAFGRSAEAGAVPESGNHIVVAGRAADSICKFVSQLTKSPNKMKADLR